MKKKIALLRGDGIGPEVITEGLKVLQLMAKKANIELEIQEALIGGIAYEKVGRPDPNETIEICKNSDAVILGAVGGTQWDELDRHLRPEKGLLRLRYDLELFANLRPAKIYDELLDSSSLKPEIICGADVMVVRELTGGIYFGQPRGIENGKFGRKGLNTMVYSEQEIRRIIKCSFDIARLRDKKLCSVDKANVLEVSGLWRDVAEEVAKDYSDVELYHLYVDNALMQLIYKPKQFDTIVTENMFGDILSDATAMITGSIGLLPSASIGEKYSLYEPVHGSAPDIAGEDKANPLAAILSIGMLFHYTFEMPQVNQEIEKAVAKTLVKYRTFDVMQEDKKLVGCQQMGDLVLQELS